MGWVIKQLFNAVCRIVKVLPIGTENDLMHYCTQPLAYEVIVYFGLCISASCRPWHLGVIVFTILQKGKTEKEH